MQKVVMSFLQKKLFSSQNAFIHLYIHKLSHQHPWSKYASCSTYPNTPDVDHLPALYFPLPADGDVYCSGVDPILVPTDSLTASHHFVVAACQHLGKAANGNTAFH